MSYWVYGLFDWARPENAPDAVWTIDSDGYNGTMDRCKEPQPMSSALYAFVTQPTVTHIKGHLDRYHTLGDVFRASYAVDAEMFDEESANRLAHDYFTRLIKSEHVQTSS